MNTEDRAALLVATFKAPELRRAARGVGMPYASEMSKGELARKLASIGYGPEQVRREIARDF